MERGTLIIGAGVVGLGIGWQLARRGEPVTILERGQAGQEASWTAAGMLAPATEVHFQEDRNLHLGLASLRQYPDFVAEVESASGMGVDYRTEGALAVALTADDAADLRALFDYQVSLGLPVRWLGAEAARELEPGLSSYLTAGVFCGMDHQVDNRLLVTALRRAFTRAGGTLLEEHEVTGMRLHPGGPQRVQAAGREFSAPRLLLAAGSWSGMLPGLPEAIRPPVRPVKGQVLALRVPEATFLRHMIRAPQVYLAPKSDGRLMVGATVEEMGFDREITAGGLYTLLRAAWEAVPGVYELPLVETRCNFRPGSRDNAPLLGESAIAGVYLATGHYRNGFLFAPVTAYGMSELMLEGRVPEALAPFSPRRFQP